MVIGREPTQIIENVYTYDWRCRNVELAPPVQK